MPNKVDSVRRALYGCFPDRPHQEINELADKDQGIRCALESFTPAELALRVMLVSVSTAPSAVRMGFLWCTTRRLLFVGTIRGLFSGTRPVSLEWGYAEIQRVEFKHGRFQPSRIDMHLAGSAERVKFESVVRSDLIRAFAEDLAGYLQAHRQGKLLIPAHDEVDASEPSEDRESGDLLERLERLALLRDSGALSEEEFSAAKKKLLQG
jgi:hypothetical protein